MSTDTLPRYQKPTLRHTDIESVKDRMDKERGFKDGEFALLFSRETPSDPDSRLRILLVYRKDLDIWNLPGGGWELGDRVGLTAVRETEEETGLKVKKLSTDSFIIAPPEGQKKQNVPALDRRDHYSGVVCAIVGGSIQLTDESRAVKWFPVDALPENLYTRHIPLIHAALEDERLVADAVAENTFVPMDLENTSSGEFV